MKRHLVFLFLLPLAAVTGCKSGPREIETNLTPPEYFQRAQQAVIERSDYETALAYYNTVLEQFPNDRQNGVIARYEIAFIHYKQENYEKAREGFEEILSLYNNDQAADLPPWPPVLADKLLQKMNGTTAAE
jgi:outer membrane protein assembly factor BamD (BamD/ComL family)